MENQNMNPSLSQSYTWNTIHNTNDNIHDHNIDMIMDHHHHHHHHNHLYEHHPITLPDQIQHQEIEELDEDEEDNQELGAMKEMMYKIASMQPVDIDPATVRRPRRRNVKISSDPQSVAARHRRERISEKIRILQRLVPGGTKMDTATMLDEAIRYVKFLKRQIRFLQSPAPAPAGFATKNDEINPSSGGIGSSPGFVTDGYEPHLLI